jgi:hypothetical protein
MQRTGGSHPGLFPDSVVDDIDFAFIEYVIGNEPSRFIKNSANSRVGALDWY